MFISLLGAALNILNEKVFSLDSACISLDGDFWQVVAKKMADFEKNSWQFVWNLCILADKNLSVNFHYVYIHDILFVFFFT